VELINPAGLPRAVGFSHLALTDHLIFVAGQTGHLPDGSIADDLVEQFAQACRNVAVCLKAAGATVEQVASIQIFVTSIAAYRERLAELGTAYRQVFGRHYPPMALLGVTELFDPRARVELVAVAVR
jgi:enamine deaminase RidA (YjgF/YER057c/UK114 family)